MSDLATTTIEKHTLSLIGNTPLVRLKKSLMSGELLTKWNFTASVSS
jgi:hypothetical protein